MSGQKGGSVADPWLRFFPQDWNGDEQLRLCSLAARGLWVAFLFPMHKAEPYGHLLLNNRKPDYTELARLVGCSPREVKYGIEELVKNGVASVTNEGVLFSRRMVRDAERRKMRQANGRLGGNPLLKLFPEKSITRHLTNKINPIASSTGSSGSGCEIEKKETPLDELLDRFLREHYPPEGYQAGWEVDQAWTAAFDGVEQESQFRLLCDAVGQHKRSQQWVDGRIPLVSRWLKEKRWNQRLRESDTGAHPVGKRRLVPDDEPL